MNLRAADIVIVHGDGFFSRLIRRFSKKAEKVRATHVAIAVDSSRVVEALPKGVVVHAFNGSGRVYRARHLAPVERLRIAERALSYVGRPYGWSKILLHAIGLQRFASIDGYPICSWVLAGPYAGEGYTFGVDPSIATPDDIEDFVLARTDLYGEVK